MARDAFGREIGEDPLETMGWERPFSGPQPVARPDPVPVDAPARPKTMRGPVPRPRSEKTIQLRRSRGPGRTLATVATAGCLVPIALTVVALVVAIGAIVSAVDEATVDLPSGARPTLSLPSATPAPRGTSADPDGFGAGSLLLARNFARALDGARRAASGRILSLRLAPERLDLQLVSKGRLRAVQVRFDGSVDVSDATGLASAGVRTSGFDAVEAAAPFRLARSAAGRAGTSPERVDYLILTVGLAGQRWVAYLEDGTYWSSGADGRGVSQLG